MNILFWNINKKKHFSDVIVEVIKEESIDLVAFAEIPEEEIPFFETELKKADLSFVYLTPTMPNKVGIFYKKGIVEIIPSYDGIINSQDSKKERKRISVNKIHSQLDNNDYHIIFCHLRDAYSTDKSQLAGFARPIVREITDYEELVNCYRTIVCGDFNVDPFESFMIECDGFNAMQTEKIAKKIHRNVAGKPYRMFYNPMWGLMGDLHGQDVSGTYYYNQSEPIQQYWHILDQVIMRPDVIPVFEKKQLKILTKGCNYNLLNQNNNIGTEYSDHLPIKFQLNI